MFSALLWGRRTWLPVVQCVSPQPAYMKFMLMPPASLSCVSDGLKLKQDAKIPPGFVSKI